jgi:hypothetical protein
MLVIARLKTLDELSMTLFKTREFMFVSVVSLLGSAAAGYGIAADGPPKFQEAVAAWKSLESRAANLYVRGRSLSTAKGYTLFRVGEFKMLGPAVCNTTTDSKEVGSDITNEAALAAEGVRTRCTDGSTAFLIERKKNAYQVFSAGGPKDVVLSSMRGFGESECRAPWGIPLMSLANADSDPRFELISLSPSTFGGAELMRLDYVLSVNEPDAHLKYSGFINVDPANTWIVRGGEIKINDEALKREIATKFEIEYDQPLAGGFPRPRRLSWERQLGEDKYTDVFEYEIYELGTRKPEEFTPQYYGLPNYGKPRSRGAFTQYSVILFFVGVAVCIAAWLLRTMTRK